MELTMRNEAVASATSAPDHGPTERRCEELQAEPTGGPDRGIT